MVRVNRKKQLVLTNIFLTYCMDKLGIDEITLSIDKLNEIVDKHINQDFKMSSDSKGTIYRIEILDKK